MDVDVVILLFVDLVCFVVPIVAPSCVLLFLLLVLVLVLATSSPRCCSCMRLEPMSVPGGGGEGPFAELSDGRMVCIACAQVTDCLSKETKYFAFLCTLPPFTDGVSQDVKRKECRTLPIVALTI